MTNYTEQQTDQLNLLSLTFAIARLEHAYTETTSHGFAAVDAHICFLKLAMAGFLLLPIWLGFIPSTALGRVLWQAYVLLLAGHQLLVRLAPKWYRQHRTLVIIPIKMLFSAALTSFVPTFVLKEATSASSFMELLLLGAGLVMQLCTGVLIPVFWKHHAAMALGTWCVYDLIMLEPLAATILCSPAAVSSAAKLYSSLDSAVYTLSGVLMPYPVQRPVAAGPRAQVYILVLWLQLHVALLAPALYLHCTEFRSRVNFWRQQEQEQAAPGSTTSRPVDARLCSPFALLHFSEDLPGRSVLVLCVFLLLFALISWNLLHLCVTWLMPMLSGWSVHALVADMATKHGLAGHCLQQLASSAA